MTPPIRTFDDRVVATVEEVDARQIIALLEVDAPHATAINAGLPIGFPRLNGLVLIPGESGATVCSISSIKIVRSPYPKRGSMQSDFALVDLPFPARTIRLIPLGTLYCHSDSSGTSYELKRGIDVFPSVGDLVLVPDRNQLRAIIEGDSQEGNRKKRALIGYNSTANWSPVYIDPDKIFGRHLAVLGNTGAGKSCSVTGLIRWSIDCAMNQLLNGSHLNARFIILDPNGEYSRAFRDLNNVVQVFEVKENRKENRNGQESHELQVPGWLWNAEEWAVFTNAALGVQRPILYEALRQLRAEIDLPDTLQTKIQGIYRRYNGIIQSAYSTGDFTKFPQRMDLLGVFKNVLSELRDLEAKDSNDIEMSSQIQSASELFERTVHGVMAGNHVKPFHVESIKKAIKSLHDLRQLAFQSEFSRSDRVSEDSPIKFNVRDLPRYIEALASAAQGRDLVQFVDSLNLRVRGILNSPVLSSVICPESQKYKNIGQWLSDILGEKDGAKKTVTIVDMSFIPSDTIHIIIAIFARLLFEGVQRYRRLNGNELPTVLVLDEAHIFVHRGLSDESSSGSGQLCSKIFERIAREGRKFGLGLVIASQRPSEISPTILSQCNSYLLHRIVNDRDQELVRRLVPDGLGEFLRELPSLPSRRAILLGSAVPVPTVVDVRELANNHRPHSPDPAFLDVWTGKAERTIDWNRISASWSERGDQASASR